MYRFLSSIRHGCGSSLTSLLAPKPTLPFDAALRSRRLPQNDGHVRGFSSSNFDWRNLIVNENVNADDSMQDAENRNSEKWNNMRLNMNADAKAPPNFVQNRGNINSRSWNNMRQNLNAPPNFMGNRENINSRSQNNLGQNVDANADALPDFMQDKENINSRSWNNMRQNVNAPPNFMGNRDNINSRSQNNMDQNVDANADALPDFMQDKENINIGNKNYAETGWNSRPMDFVRGIIDEDNFGRGSPYHQYQYEQDADFVHIKMLRNNTFVTVTDSKGNIKLSGSAGPLKDLKSGQKLSRYAAEATAEVVGRKARGLGLKSVVMKVNGFTHFRRKRNAIMSWKEGFTAGSRGDRNPIVYIEDTTRKPHNGCRLPKKRRI